MAAEKDEKDVETMPTGNKIRVFDAAGVERLVDPVDAREIIAAGGTSDAPPPPLKEKVKQTHPAEAKAGKGKK